MSDKEKSKKDAKTEKAKVKKPETEASAEEQTEEIIDNQDTEETEDETIQIDGEVPVEEPLNEEEVVVVKKVDTSGWKPKTELGEKVKRGEIDNMSDIKESGAVVHEPEITEVLFPELESDLLLIGQAKGKFGGGQRRVFKQTQKKTKEGNKPSFSTCAVVGNNNGFVGVGFGKSKETVPAREKAIRNAKISIMQIKRGCGSWQCHCATSHSIPFEVTGKCGSVEIRLIPAPKGTGLCCEPEISKILKLAGITDIWSKCKGHTKTKINLVKACVQALENLSRMKTFSDDEKNLGIQRGTLKG